MSEDINVAELARRVAGIARDTKDPDTGRRLMELVEELLSAGGLSSQEPEGDAPPRC